MNLPVETKPAFWGAVGGAAAAAIIGFGWAGWVTGATAEAAASQRASTAVVVALAPFCVDKFRGAADAPANLAVLKKADLWAQGEFVEKGGWAKLSASSPPEQVSAVARSCAALLQAG